MESAAIRATSLCKSFGEGAATTLAVRDATFEAHCGEMLFVVGPSGSGKTTLLSVISGILRPSSGTVVVKGANLWQLSADDLAEFRLQAIGFAFQDFHLFPKLTTAENVAILLVLRREDWNASLKKGEQLLAIVGLKDRGQLPPVKLSGGEQQQVAIARALVGDPELLILDEPTASLDGDTGRMHYAVPLYSGGALVKLRDGTYQAVTVMGLDDTDLVGPPQAGAGQYRRHLC